MIPYSVQMLGSTLDTVHSVSLCRLSHRFSACGVDVGSRGRFSAPVSRSGYTLSRLFHEDVWLNFTLSPRESGFSLCGMLLDHGVPPVGHGSSLGVLAPMNGTMLVHGRPCRSSRLPVVRGHSHVRLQFDHDRPCL